MPVCTRKELVLGSQFNKSFNYVVDLKGLNLLDVKKELHFTENDFKNDTNTSFWATWVP